MKKGLLLLLTCISLPAYAANLTLDVSMEENNRKLEIKTENGESISYEEAVQEYTIEEYIRFYYQGEYFYFYKGNEITESEYELGREQEAIKKKENETHKHIHTTEELIKAIDDVYEKEGKEEYHFLYTKQEYASLDQEAVKKHYQEKYMVPENKNMFTYDEYYLYAPMRNFPLFTEEEFVVNARTLKTNQEEIKKVNQFLDYFLSYFQELTEYEKIISVYRYLSHTLEYKIDNGYTVFLDADLSAYDAFFRHQAVCIGAATTFQLMMEKLGISSYIVEELVKNESMVSSIHTYNLVELNGLWYVVDLKYQDNFDGLLKAYEATTPLYYSLPTSPNAYPIAIEKGIFFDYQAIEKRIASIEENKKEEKEDLSNQEKKKESRIVMEYLILMLIVTIVFLVIYIFTRKK